MRENELLSVTLTFTYIKFFTHDIHTSFLRSKALNLDGSINNPAMHGNFTNIPIDMGSEWMYVGTDIESE